jgi:hypothetical protein
MNYLDLTLKEKALVASFASTDPVAHLVASISQAIPTLIFGVYSIAEDDAQAMALAVVCFILVLVGRGINDCRSIAAVKSLHSKIQKSLEQESSTDEGGIR